jgi:hypothetical protein
MMMTEIQTTIAPAELAAHLLEHATLITASWRTAAASIVETGRLINLAEQELSPSDYRTLRLYLVENSGLSQTVVSKLKTIARNPTLLNPDYQGKLPPSYATLYHIAKIDETKLKEAIEQGVINPNTQLRDVTSNFETVKKRRNKDKENNQPPRVLIRISGAIDTASMSALNALCEQISGKVQLKCVGFASQ